MRSYCDAVHTFPAVNASVDGDTLVVHHDVNLGIAVDLGAAGLIFKRLVRLAATTIAVIASTSQIMCIQNQ